MWKLPPFLRDLLGTHGEPKAEPYAAPLFVTGAMRSGTTFLVDKLASHPQLLKIGSELNAVWTEIGDAPIVGRCAHRSAGELKPVALYRMSRYFQAFIDEAKTTKRQWMRRYTRVYDGLGRAHYDWQHLIPVNKSPHLMNKLGYVGAMFPEGTLILIVRDIHSHSASMKVHFDKWHARDGRVYTVPDDPMDCWSSAKNAEPTEQGYPGNFKRIPEMWIRLNALALRELEASGFKQKIVLSYEDLITDQAKVLSALFDTLPLRKAHQDEAFKISKRATVLVNTTTKGDPLKKWESQLSTEEKQGIEDAIAKNRDDYNFIRESVERLKLRTS